VDAAHTCLLALRALFSNEEDVLVLLHVLLRRDPLLVGLIEGLGLQLTDLGEDRGRLFRDETGAVVDVNLDRDTLLQAVYEVCAPLKVRVGLQTGDQLVPGAERLEGAFVFFVLLVGVLLIVDWVHFLQE